MAFQQFEVEFTKSGDVFNAAQVNALLQAVGGLTDLFVISHGWNNDAAEARSLYDNLFKSVVEVMDAGVVKGLDGRTFGVMRILWPSKKFADEDLIPGGGAASATHENDTALLKLLEDLKSDPKRLGGHDKSAVRQKALSAAQALVPHLENDAAARQKYVFLLRSILSPEDAHVEDGSEEFFSREPQELFDGLAGAVNAPGGRGIGGATSVGHAGGAAGLKDLVSGVKAAARRLANFATYYAMKERAGIVGRTGVAQVLHRVRDRKSDVRLHLIGHSFGGRLVTSAANALAANTPAVTISLLQAAYSHNGLAKDFDKENHDGAFRAVMSEKRVSGPIIITHTKNDKAVGIAYPLASRIARDQASAMGDEKDPYGGMGRNGAQATPEAQGVAGDLLAVGKSYAFVAGKVFNLKADAFISNHSDVTGQQVAYAVLNAVKTI
ncbi:MAG TPA: hypothetical protein VGO53_02565 [Steroidobacteraceae bacterium]|jgi:hypothetical protein|nr:hypothetical protein [Steroidobacteraceae bacterium]